MLSSNRGHYLAIGGCIAFLLLAIPALGQTPESAGGAEGKPPQSSTPASPADNSEPQTSPAPVQSAPIEQPPQPESADAPEADNGYYAREDLKAQQAMAEATESIVFWTRVQIGLGIVGTALLLWTLYEAKRSTDVASDTASRQLRAYVNLEFASLDWDNGWTIMASATFKNTGQTPAYRLSHAGRIEVGETDTFDEQLLDVPGGAMADFGAGADIPARNLRASLKEEEWRGIRNGEIPLYMWGRISYDDAFKKTRRHTRYRLIYDFHNGKWAPCAEGNEST